MIIMKRSLRTCGLVYILIGLAFFAVLFVIGGILVSAPLTTTSYSVEVDISKRIRIVHLTDLHSREFGDDNQELISSIEDIHPDVIFMTGDMLDREDETPGVVLNLISELVKIAPVYYGYGNHEVEWDQRNKYNLKEMLQQAGATVLICDYIDTEINNQNVRIGGYYNYFKQPHMLIDDKEKIVKERDWADEFMDTDQQKLLLSHIPTGWLDWGQIDRYDVGVVFCGHYHGGLIRIPIIEQGLYAPYVEWFPEYTVGMFSGEVSTCILSTGLSTEHGIPRIYNPPEIVVVDLIPE